MAKKRNFKNKTPHKKKIVCKQTPLEDTINSEAIAAALSSINQPVLLKICRLCESKDGPFLNIFDADRITAKKIEDIMPFGIAENDELSHKICFRCSAKLEELYEFIQKCIKTQLNLRKAAGKKGPLVPKMKTRTIWEEKLNQSNISNDDICDALIKKAMEGIKDIPLKVAQDEPAMSTKETNKDSISLETSFQKESTQEKVVSKKKSVAKRKVVSKDQSEADEDKSINNIDLKHIKLEIEKKLTIQKNPQSTKSNDDMTQKEIESSTKPKSKSIIDKVENIKVENKSIKDVCEDKNACQTKLLTIEKNPDVNNKPTFNIMDHVSMIKVNGVGVLFQCKLCNRNFLKKDVVMSHACAKNGASKIEPVKDVPPPEPPKIPTVKYITTKPEAEHRKPIVVDDSPISIDDDDDDEDDKPLLCRKVKPKIGPASKVKKAQTPSPSLKIDITHSPPKSSATPNVNMSAPTVQIPTAPKLNGQYKLVPGPNNTFTLVEEQSSQTATSGQPTSLPDPPADHPSEPMKADAKSSPKCKQSNKRGANNNTKSSETSTQQPYPVGLFQTLAHISNALNVPAEPVPTSYTASTTTTAKKQSYTVVQTGNPSKLLISTKAQDPVEEVPKKRPRKTRNDIKIDDTQKQPFSVTLEDAAPPRDAGFFTFINVDPLLQPSYVLPTNNIIQESQISTSTSAVVQSEAKSEKDPKYSCNMCNEKFTREKKLLTHIQHHYKTMDDEDLLRSEKDKRKDSSKKRSRPKRGSERF